MISRLRQRERMRAMPFEGVSTEDSRELLTTKPTPCTRCSTGAFPCQKKVQSSSFRVPFEGSLVSCSAAMSMLSLLSSRLMTAVFLALSICCRSSERRGHNVMVLTFQVASLSAGGFAFFLLLLPVRDLQSALRCCS